MAQNDAHSADKRMPAAGRPVKMEKRLHDEGCVTNQLDIRAHHRLQPHGSQTAAEHTTETTRRAPRTTPTVLPAKSAKLFTSLDFKPKTAW